MKRLGDFLLDKRMITSQQLALALQEQRRTDELLGDVFIRLGVLTRKDLAKVIAESSRISFVDLKQTYIDPDAITILSKELVRKYKLMPYALQDDTLKIAMDNTSDVFAIDVVRRTTGKRVEVAASDLETIMEMVEIYYEVGVSLEEEIDKNVSAALGGGIAEGEVAPPIVRLLELFLIKAIRNGATDIHITLEERASRVSYRIDGILRSESILPEQIHPAVVTRVKVISGLNIAEQRLPQEGNTTFEFSGRKIDIRTATAPGIYGENLVLRILDKANVILGLDHLGLKESNQVTIRKLCLKPHGIVLVAGPTGSGKTTTLYSMLREINALEKNVLTIEDPVEYQLPLIKQTQVNEQAGLTFDTAIRHFLRQDPDIILVGEIRDLETARIAFRAAMTGHLVLSTIHTNDSASTIARLLDLGVEPYLIPTTLRAVVAQRLIRRVCPHCFEEYQPDNGELALYDIGEQWNQEGKPIRKAKGCPECDYTGYRGRTAIFEIFEVSPRISRMIIEKASADMLEEEARKEGMLTLREEGLSRVLSGISTLEEVARVT